MADGEIDFTSPERLKNQKVKPSGPDLNSKELYNYTTSPKDLETNTPPSIKMKMAPTIATEETKMKTYIVKDKIGLNGSIKEIYAHQYDSRRHILISEASFGKQTPYTYGVGTQTTPRDSGEKLVPRTDNDRFVPGTIDSKPKMRYKDTENSNEKEFVPEEKFTDRAPSANPYGNLDAAKEEMFSAEELEHLASIMEANPVSPTDPEVNRTARKIGNTDQVGSSVNTNTVSSRDLTDEYQLDEAGVRSMSRGNVKGRDYDPDKKYKQNPAYGSAKSYLKPWEKSKAQENSEKDKAVAEYKGKVTKLPPGKAKGLKEGKDEREYGYEGDMAISQIKSIMNHSDQLVKMLKPDTDLPEWVQKKITLASDYIQTAADYMATEMNEEVELEEGRGRPPKPGSAAYKRKHGESSSETSDDTAHQGRDPRQHIQVVAGQAAGGRHMDFTHNDGSKSKITPAMGRRITSHLYGLKPAERQAAVNKMHDSSDGLKV